MTKAIIVFGSSRRDGNTGQAADYLASLLSCDVIDVGAANITPYDYQHRNQDDEFMPIMKRIIEHEIIIFASPIYWYSMSAQLKIFVDRFTDLLSIDKDTGRELRGRKTIVLSTGAEPVVADCFVETFKKTFHYLGIPLMHDEYVICLPDFSVAEHGQQLRQLAEKISSI